MFRLIFMLLFLVLSLFGEEGKRYRVSVVAGSYDYVKGVEYYITHLNKRGGINGVKVELNVCIDDFDDKKAKECALKIAKDGKTLAVIGHSWSSQSIIGGRIYKKYKIPAITPTSTNDFVTLNNEYYFRTIYADSFGGKLLANYVRVSMGSDNSLLINDSGKYGTFLAKQYSTAAKDIGLNISENFTVNTTDSPETVDEQIKDIIEKLKEIEDSDIGTIFLAANSKTLVKLVKAIRESNIKNRILVCDAGASNSFLKPISSALNQTLLTNKLYIATPFIFDAADSYTQQFRDLFDKEYGQPTAEVAFSYDSMRLIRKAIEHSNIYNSKRTLAKDREKIKNYLASIDSIDKAIIGLTGLTYFNEHGDATKIIKIGEIKNGRIVSSAIQLKEVENIYNEVDLNEKLKSNSIFKVGDKFLYQTNIVHTAINFKLLDNIDYKNKSFYAEFDMWIRSKYDIDTKNIIFENALSTITLDSPIRVEKTDNYVYELYSLKGTFKMDTIVGWNRLNEHILGVQFYHKNLNKNNLIFIKDFIGVDSEEIGFYDNNFILNPQYNLKIKNVIYFQDVLQRSSMGNSKYVATSKSKIEHSRFNTQITVVKDTIDLNEFFDKYTIFYIFMFTILLKLIHYTLIKKIVNKYYIFLQYFNSILLVITLQATVLNFSYILDDYINKKLLSYFLIYSNMLYWIISAYFLNLAFNVFLWNVLDKKTESSTPKLIKRLILFIIYLLAFFGIISEIFNQDITKLLATSGMVAMIIGLGIKNNISNIFTGLAINLEKPFKIGDFVSLRSDKKDFFGEIIDMTWRSTKLKTTDKAILNIPNHNLSTSYIKNFVGVPYLQFNLTISVIYNPSEILEILVKAGKSVENVVSKDPIEASARVESINDKVVNYSIKIKFKTDKCYAKKTDIANRLWATFWKKFEEIEPSQKYVDKQRLIYQHRE